MFEYFYSYSNEIQILKFIIYLLIYAVEGIQCSSRGFTISSEIELNCILYILYLYKKRRIEMWQLYINTIVVEQITAEENSNLKDHVFALIPVLWSLVLNYRQLLNQELI